MKTRNYILLAGLTLMALSACQKAEEADTTLPAEEKTEGHTVRIVASFSDATKTTISQDGEGHYTACWEAGDQIYIRELVRAVSPDGTDVMEDGTSFFPVASNPLVDGGETAVFTATFATYDWESYEMYSDYTFYYTYLASTRPGWYFKKDEDGEDYVPLILDHTQYTYAGGVSTQSDLMISKWSETYPSRPDEISFQFARLGSVVEITLAGLEPGDVLQSGTWYTGDEYMSTCSQEEIISYNPTLGKYRSEIPEYMMWLVYGRDFHAINFSCPSDPDIPWSAPENLSGKPDIVADAEGKATLYLRSLPGTMSDWFGLICDVKRGEETITYSREISLSSLKRSLEFKEAGLTTFQVKLLPAQAETLPESVEYTTSESPDRDGFTAVWKEGAHLSGYDCYYTYGREGSAGNLEVQSVGDGYVGVKVPSGLEAGRYYLYIKGIPDAVSGPQSFDYFEKELVVGEPVSLEFVGNAKLVDGSSDVYVIHNRSTWAYKDEFAYVQASNTNFGTYSGDALYASDRSLAWGFRTAPSQTFPGGLEKLTFTLGKWYDVVSYNTPDVYGIRVNPDTTETETQLTPATVSGYNYEYDLAGYDGFRIHCASSATLSRVYLSYYK